MVTKRKLNSKTKIILWTLLLIVIDQSIKIYISNNLMQKNFNTWDQIIEFQPRLYTKLSTLVYKCKKRCRGQTGRQSRLPLRNVIHTRL